MRSKPASETINDKTYQWRFRFKRQPIEHLTVGFMKNEIKKMGNQSSAIYGMAFIGALVYFIQHATSFWAGVLGFFKAVFWPAMIVYKVLELLKL